ncbi:MAG TPA: Fic family protein, partial [Polyangiaceae bacterium]
DVLVNQHRLNERQAVAVERLLEVGHVDIRTFQELCPDAARRTLQRDLAALEAKGLMVTEGDTNNLIYRLKEGV